MLDEDRGPRLEVGALSEELGELLRAKGATVDRLSATQREPAPLHRVDLMYSDVAAERALSGLGLLAFGLPYFADLAAS